MRYADISAPTFADGSIPAVPSLPIDRFASSGRGGAFQGAEDDEAVREPRDLEQAKEEGRKADLHAMEGEDFDPDACMPFSVFIYLVRSNKYIIYPFLRSEK